MFTLESLDLRSKLAAAVFSIMISAFTVTGFVGGAMVPVSTVQATATAAIVLPLA